MPPKCSFIVSAFDRPLHLKGCLFSLAVQTEPDFEVIVTDNAPLIVGGDWFDNEVAVRQMNDSRFIYLHTGLGDCYQSGDAGAEQAIGEYLCFPSDDSYYLPTFLADMLATGADLILCDFINDIRVRPIGTLDCRIHACNSVEGYTVVDARAELGLVDKTSFLVRRDVFSGFVGNIPGELCCADGLTVESLVKRGLSVAKVAVPLVVHN
jgi:hypothetical protein